MQFRKEDRGQALVLMAIAVAVLMVIVGFGVEVGFLKYKKQRMQQAADAGAVGGAATKLFGGQYVTAARNDSAANGFTHGSNGITVTVNSPPSTGPYDDKYVEVIVSQAQPTFFMKVGGFGSVNVSARAVASTAQSSSSCIYVLDPTASAAYSAGGNATLNSACGIKVNSSASGAFYDGGSACTNATSISVVGTANASCVTPTPVTGAAHFSDPLSYIPAPAVGACDYNNYSGNKGTYVLNPGVYCGGITFHSSADVTFNPGVYIIDGGGIGWNGQATIHGTGVTFYLTGDSKHAYSPLKINGGSNIQQLSAPTTGTYAGILFMEDRNVATTGGSGSTNKINGTNTSTFDGALYFPTTTLEYTGNSTANGYSIIVADMFALQGNTQVNDNYSSLPGGVSPIHTSGLVE